VCVIGGGVVGCAVSYRLSRNDFAVTLIERDGIAAHASGHNAGNINPLHGTAAKLIPFALNSFRLHRGLRAEIAPFLRAQAQQVRRLHLGFSAADRAELEHTAALFNATEGFCARWLDPSDLAGHDARLAKDAASALLTEGNLAIDGAVFTRALADAATHAGATIIRQAATGLATRGDRITGVRTGEGVIACDAVVLATGPWTTESKEWLGIDIPVAPLKGEMLLVRLPGGKPPFDCSWGGTSLYRWRGDDLWIGATQAHTGFYAAPTPHARETLLSRAARIMPAATEATVLRHVAALRPMPQGGAVLAAAAPGWSNAFLANGAGGKGVLLCAGIADAIVTLVGGEYCAAPLPAFSA